MSDKPEIELDLDLQLLPAWARQPQAANRYADFEEGGERRGPRGRGPGGPGGPRRDFRGDRRPDNRGPRPEGQGGGGRFSRGDDRGGRGRGDRGGGPGDRGGGRRFDGPRRDPVEDLPEGITVDMIPEPAGVDSLTRQIRQTGRAYPLFDIGHLILKRPDRYQLEFRATGNVAEGKPRQLFVCSLDDTVWLTEEEAVRHVLTKHFDTFYQTERISVDPPKGTYTFVAQCGMSGIILGPPNLHDYQAKLQRLHAERFARMPFEMFKSRVRIVRDEAVVKQWVEQQSFKNEFVCLNLPEPLKLNSREAVEQHFRQVHLPNIIRGVGSHVVRTPAARESLPPGLRRLARREFELQQRFPLKLVTRLSDDFAHRGLHFFKVNRTVLHVAVARPRYLDLETNPVTDGVKNIINAIQSTPKCTRRKLLEVLGVPLPAGADAAAPAPAAGEAPAPEAPPSPELQAIITDLHWLIHEGHVIEFANGQMEAAKKPAPRPQPVPRPPKPAAAPAAASAATDAATPATENAPVAATVAPESGEVTGDVAVAESDAPAVESTETTEVPAESESSVATETEVASENTPAETPEAPPAVTADDESKSNPS
ncbi:MAG: hypothetical protein JNK85_18205 [Verrucomicrobiales bacterium]|nr:hypothetical protein [Verrucomicrobiales bacterium]